MATKELIEGRLPNGVELLGMAPDWVFGYGSIINNTSRASTAHATSDTSPSSSSGGSADAVLVHLLPSFGMVRCWNFRAKSGFTAVGLRARAEQEPALRTCGVLFPATGSMGAFDERERGYQRRPLSFADLEIPEPSRDQRRGELELVDALRRVAEGPDPPRLWVYVPLQESQHSPSTDFPICQTYVDTILQGCFAWGGRSLASEWVASTFGWSLFFLNDSPLSRRPWLHRPRHAEIDEVLMQHAEWTHFAARRHPEEFAAQWHANLRGMWGVPARNQSFIGREQELRSISAAFRTTDGQTSSGVTVIEAVGLGGVGKTQMATEYCHRHYQALDGDFAYGLVVWLRAESADSIAAGFRDLATDAGLAVKDMHNEQIVEEMRSRLFRAGCPWLLVFDNVEDTAVLDLYMPRGGCAAGHILVTTRTVLPGVPKDRRVAVDCFTPEESLAFLDRSVGAHAQECVASAEGSPQVTAGAALAEALGHLPLALAMAAGYMSQCDTTCAEYRLMLRSSPNLLAGGLRGVGAHKLVGYPLGVTESLSLSLRRMRQGEGHDGRIRAQSVLSCLGFLAPEGITKRLVSLLAKELQADASQPCQASEPRRGGWQLLHRHIPPRATALLGLCLCLLLAVTAAATVRRTSRWRLRLLSLATGGAAVASWLLPSAASPAPQAGAPGETPSSCKSEAGELVRQPSEYGDLSVETDRIWVLLKQYSLLSMRDRTASMHRLLQQLLRAMQEEEQAGKSVGHCICALQSLWSFDPADTRTWAEAGQLVEHVKVVGSHVDQLLHKTRGRWPPLISLPALCTAADLLTDAGLYMSMALSRFDEANHVLEEALRIHEIQLRGCAFSSGGCAAASADLARTLHTQGQVARYQGRAQDAALHLDKALEIRRRLVKQKEAYLWDVASSLHELGVLRLRQREPEAAQATLRESLAMKRSLRQRSVAPALARQHRFSDEAATLHQLAVAAMSCKPSRLDEAETLLQEALTVETTGNPSGRAARAASLQQLARVEIRRGRLASAQGNLQEALALHQETYGKDTPHVNVVAVRTQLGKVSCELGLKAEGSEREALLQEGSWHLLEALRSQQRIYGTRFLVEPAAPQAQAQPSATVASDHPEIAYTLGQLGMVERARQSLAAAQQHFTAQRAMLSRLLEDVPPAAVGSKQRDSRSEQLLRQLLEAFRWEKIVAREVGDAERVKWLAAEMKSAASRFSEASQETTAALQAARGESLSCMAICQACVSCRDAVRKAVLTAERDGAPVDPGVYACAAEKMDGSLAAADEFGEVGESAENAEGQLADLAQLREAAVEFREALRSPGSDRQKLAACDAMRAVLRRLQVKGVN